MYAKTGKNTLVTAAEQKSRRIPRGPRDGAGFLPPPCLWQVSGRDQTAFDEWVELDLQYIDSGSLTNDLRILLLTLPVVLGGGGS